MTKTMSRPTRWLSATGLGVVAAWTLAACGGGPPELTEISESAQQSMDEANSLTFTMEDPDNLLGEGLSSMEYSGQSNETNFRIAVAMEGANIEVLVIDESTAYAKYEFEDEEAGSLFGMGEDAAGQWIETPESDLMGVDEVTAQFDEMSNGVFSLIDNLSEEELEAVEVEETELDGQQVYKYDVPATGQVETEVAPGADTASFYFSQESNELLQLDASTEDATAVFTFSDYDSVEPIEAPPEEEIADIDWEF
ncbi:hypothetical protein GCM10009720_18820 [Yaniella flava]|uniref:Lipoprotein n=1 Tax=Yaniella flava TaxID=287930 RepID=A0ABP5G244_9MICC